MKIIMAVIKPSKLEDVRGALSPLGVIGVTVSEVKGFGCQGGHTGIYRGAEYEIHFVPKIKIEGAVMDNVAENVETAIQENANTGKIDDGKIFVFDVAEAVRIRTGETDGDVL